MKKTTLSILILASMLPSLACQALSSLTNKTPTESPVPAYTPTVIAPTQVMDAATATETVQTPGVEGWIALENQNNLWLVHPDGSGLTKLTSLPASSSAQRIPLGGWKWSPDGNTLAYIVNTHGEPAVYGFDLQTSEIRTLFQNFDGSFDWSPTGKGILYDTVMTGDNPTQFKNKGVWEFNLTDEKSHLVISPRDGLPAVLKPQVSPDGSHVLFTTPCMEESCIGHGIANYQTGKPVYLSALGGSCTWSPTSTQVACISYVTDNSTNLTSQELSIFGVDGKIQQTFPLTESLHTSMAWSPNGETLAIGYYSDSSGQTDLLQMANGDRHFLASGVPSGWSPDGQWVLTWESDLSGNTSKSYVVNAASGQVFPLAEGTFPAWQPTSGSTTIGSLPEESAPTATPFQLLEITETPTAVQSSSCADVSITVKDTSKGDYLEICADGRTYEMGPLEKGDYAIGPNKKFFVYVTNSGIAYAARIGDTRLTLLGDLKEFTFIKVRKNPSYDFKFFGDHPYTVQIFELQYTQNKVFSIPRRISNPE